MLPKPKIDYAALLEFCQTPNQTKVIQSFVKNGKGVTVSADLKLSTTVVSRHLNRVKLLAAQQGYSPAHDMTRTVPEGFKVRGVSTYYDKEGKVRGQWVKSQEDAEARRKIYQAAFDALAVDLPRQAPTASPVMTSGKLCNVYTLTDCHVGALAWHKESGQDWDLAIAEKTLFDCFAEMINASPAADTCVVSQLGDFLHSDGLLPVTPTHGHILDQDGRFAKVVQVAVRLLRHVVNLALTKHNKVVVLMAEGNHDMASSIWLRTLFQALYEKEKRVQVIDSILPYYVYQHGKTMLAFHHGHLKKLEGLPLLFAAQFPEMWGRTKKRYCHTGHRHHTEEKEHSGITVVQHATLAARDAYAARGGWLAERKATAITYHSEHGEVARNTVTPEMLE